MSHCIVFLTRFFLAGLLGVLLLTACGTTPPAPVTAPQPETTQPVKKPRPTPDPATAPSTPAEPQLLLLLDSNDPTHCRLAEELRARSPLPVQTLALDKIRNKEQQKQLLQASGPVVALGLEAARIAAPLAKTHLVLFSLVFNHTDHKLLEQGMIGISMLPPPAQVVALVRKLSPDVTRLALPCGPGLHSYLQQVRDAAGNNGLEVVSAEVGSNKELLLFTGKLDAAVGAYWLLPDNRILSRETIRQLLALNLKAGRRSLVFSPELFRFGGLYSVRFDERAIVAQMTEVLKKPPQGRARLRGRLLQPDKGIVDINAELAATLGMKIPAEYQPLLRRGEP